MLIWVSFFFVSICLLYQVLPMATAAAVGSARSSPVHRGAWEQFMRCSIVWGSPHAHALEVVKLHLFMEALHLPSPTQSRFSVFQTAQGWSWRVARHSLGAMPLSLHRAAWLPRLFHCSCHSVILAMAGEVSRATLVSRKLLLDGSCFWAAE